MNNFKYMALLHHLASLKESGALLELEEPYPVRPVSRWGCGKPLHQGLVSLFDARRADYAPVLEAIARHESAFRAIPAEAPADLASPYWNNGWLPPLDGMSIYALVAERRPARFIEVGSGNSTKFAARAIRDHGTSTRIVSIDPSPRAEIDGLCETVIRCPLEDMDPAFFATVTADDLVFVDCSHRALQNSDVTAFFLDILPLLPAGCVFGVHDICLPADYPPEWEKRYYSEQYMLATLLLYGAQGFDILLPTTMFHWCPNCACRCAPWSPSCKGWSPGASAASAGCANARGCFQITSRNC